MDHGENKHCTETEYSRRYHYNSRVATGVKDPHDRIELMGKHKSYPSLSFEMPRQRFELEKVEQMLAVAYERGKSDQRAAISKLLKDVIGL